MGPTASLVTNLLGICPTRCRERDGAGTVRCDVRRLVTTANRDRPCRTAKTLPGYLVPTPRSFTFAAEDESPAHEIGVRVPPDCKFGSSPPEHWIVKPWRWIPSRPQIRWPSKNTVAFVPTIPSRLTVVLPKSNS